MTSILVWNHVALFYSFQKEIKNFSKRMATPLFLSSLSNFFKYNGLWAFSFILMFFSIAGIPPLSGFLSKIFILFGLINSNQLIGAISLIMISAISVFYYIRVIKVVFFESKEAKARNDQFQTIFTVNLFDFDCLVISICLFCLVYFFFYPSTLLLLCQYIVLSSFWF